VVPSEFLAALRNKSANLDLKTWSERGYAVVPESAYSLTNLAERFYFSGKFVKAGKAAIMCTKKFPRYARAYMIAGLAFAELNNGKAAVNYALYALKLDPKLNFGHNNLGHIYYKLKMNKKAVTEYYNEMALYPENPQPYYNLAVIYQELNMDKEAEKIILKGLEKTDSGSLHGQLAKIYNKKGNTMKAIMECKQAVRLSPYDPEAYYQLGLILVKKDEIDAAVEMHKVLKVLDSKMAAQLYKKIQAAREE
jgi:tetratricopeptide (TPR) repeat protein